MLCLTECNPGRSCLLSISKGAGTPVVPWACVQYVRLLLFQVYACKNTYTSAVVEIISLSTLFLIIYCLPVAEVNLTFRGLKFLESHVKFPGNTSK